MTKLKMLITALLVSLTAFSQTDTSKAVKCLPIVTVKKIMKDLLIGDSAIEQLKITELQISQLNYKISSQDSLITLMRQKEQNYLKVIDLGNDKSEVFKTELEYVQKELEKEKKKSFFRTISNTAIIGSLLIILIFK